MRLVALSLQMTDCVNMLKLKVNCLFWEPQLECHQVVRSGFAQMALNFLSPHWRNVSSSWSWKQHLCERWNISCFLFGLNVALNPDWTLSVPEVAFGGAHMNIILALSSPNHRHLSSQELLLELVMLAQGQSHLKCLWCSERHSSKTCVDSTCVSNFNLIFYFITIIN